MRWQIAIAMAALLTAVLLWPGPDNKSGTLATASGSTSDDVARSATGSASGSAPSMPENVRQIIQAKCTECHGQDAPTPPMGFNYVLNVPKLIETGKIVPDKPESGLLLQMVESRQMPAPSAKNGPLSPQQMQAIRQWAYSLAGKQAPAQEAGSQPQTAIAPGENEGAQATFGDRLGTLFGHFHVLIVHLPIGFIIGAGLAELAGFVRRRKFFDYASAYCIVLGGAFAILSAVTGDSLSETLSWTGRTKVLMETHMTLGIITACLSGLGALLVWPSRKWPESAWMTVYRVVVLAAFVCVFFTGHFGGTLVYGEKWLAW